jgi:hypothetical protein
VSQQGNDSVNQGSNPCPPTEVCYGFSPRALYSPANDHTTVVSLYGDKDGFDSGPTDPPNTDVWLYGEQYWTHTYDISDLGTIKGASLEVFANGIGMTGSAAPIFLNGKFLGNLKPGENPGVGNISQESTFDLMPFVTEINGSTTFTIWTLSSDGWMLDYGQLTISDVPKPVLEPVDKMSPTGSVHAYPNMIWPPNQKMVTVTLSGYVVDEMSIARDATGIGISNAYLMLEGNKITLRDGNIDLLYPDASFSLETQVEAKEGAHYKVELYAADTYPEEGGGPNSALVDSVVISVEKSER